MNVLTGWFPPGAVEELERLETDQVGARHRVGHSVRWNDPAGGSLVFRTAGLPGRTASASTLAGAMRATPRGH